MRLSRHPSRPPSHPNTLQIHRPSPCHWKAPIQPSGHIQPTRSHPWFRCTRPLPSRTGRLPRHMVHPLPHHPSCLYRPPRAPGGPPCTASPRPPQTTYTLLHHGYLPPCPPTTGCTHPTTVHNPGTDHRYTHRPMAQLFAGHIHSPSSAWTNPTQHKLPGRNRLCHHHRH